MNKFWSAYATLPTPKWTLNAFSGVKARFLNLFRGFGATYTNAVTDTTQPQPNELEWLDHQAESQPSTSRDPIPDSTMENDDETDDDEQSTNRRRRPKMHVVSAKEFNELQAAKKRLTYLEAAKKRAKRRKLEGPFKCNQCDKEFSGRGSLTMHKKSHVEPSGQYVCDICNKSDFKALHNLLEHKKIHNHTKFTCEYCGKKFGARHLLKTHQRCNLKCKEAGTKSLRILVERLPRS